MELEPSSSSFEPIADTRPRMLPPPPVRLVSVDDVLLVAGVGQEAILDAFYVEILQFERALEADRPVYAADNFRIRFDWREGLIQRDDFRMLAIEVPSLNEAERLLVEKEIEYIQGHGLHPGQEALVLQDPAGNWIQLREYRTIG